VSEEELTAISEFRNLPRQELIARYTRLMNGIRSLTERPNGDCVFFVEGKCSIHPVKPAQCRLYPFWFQNVRNEAAWEQTCAECPGIGEGDWVSPEEIFLQVTEDLETGGSR
jgi:Fe-S-cluster containining protein